MSIDKYYLKYDRAIDHGKRVAPVRNRIRDLREDHDLTQQQVADAIGITQRKYSYLETETQPLTDELLVRLADLYQVSIDYLLLRTDDPRRRKKL